MRCPRCQHENRPGAKFCEECAAALARACANCGAQLSPTAKFCSECAHPAGQGVPSASQRFAAPESYTPKHLAEKILTSKAALEGERKQVTVLFADLKGSMELLADRDPEDARKILDPVLTLMMDAVHRYEGTVNQVMGDGIMALFGAPLGHEDHAVRACYAALAMQEAIRRYTEEVRRSHGIEVQIRVGLNSGEVVVRAIGSDLRMDYTAVGQTTHLAARMEQLAPPGAIRLTADTLRLAAGYILVRSLGRVPVKGVAKPVEVYEATGAGTARSRLQAAAAGGLSRFVGRDGEIERLDQAQQRAAAGHGQIVAVVGEAGVGKSRLYWEFTRSHHLSLTLWVQGYPDQAVRCSEEVLGLARGLGHPPSTIIAYFMAAELRGDRGEHDAAAQRAEVAAELSSAHGQMSYLDRASTFLGALRVELQPGDDLPARLAHALTAARRGGWNWRDLWALVRLMALCGQAGHVEQALAALAEIAAGLQPPNLYEGELHRLNGELLERQTGANPTEAEAAFRRAAEIARARGHKSFELRAATDLARLLSRQERREEARRMLAEVYGSFTEGFDTADLREAAMLLEALR